MQEIPKQDFILLEREIDSQMILSSVSNIQHLLQKSVLYVFHTFLLSWYINLWKKFNATDLQNKESKRCKLWPKDLQNFFFHFQKTRNPSDVLPNGFPTFPFLLFIVGAQIILDSVKFLNAKVLYLEERFNGLEWKYVLKEISVLVFY